jgi:hypothetical protein
LPCDFYRDLPYGKHPSYIYYTKRVLDVDQGMAYRNTRKSGAHLDGIFRPQQGIGLDRAPKGGGWNTTIRFDEDVRFVLRWSAVAHGPRIADIFPQVPRSDRRDRLHDLEDRLGDMHMSGPGCQKLMANRTMLAD